MKTKFLFALLFLTVASLQAQDKSALVFSTANGAIDGYDPVAYFTKQKPVKGKKAHQLEWHKAIWYFSTDENLKTFEQNPEKYAPQYGGWCAYGWSKGYPAKVVPEAWSIVGGKLYLNHSPNVKMKWEKNTKVHIERADANYPNAKPKKKKEKKH